MRAKIKKHTYYDLVEPILTSNAQNHFVVNLKLGVPQWTNKENTRQRKIFVKSYDHTDIAV